MKTDFSENKIKELKFIFSKINCIDCNTSINIPIKNSMYGIVSCECKASQLGNNYYSGNYTYTFRSLNLDNIFLTFCIDAFCVKHNVMFEISGLNYTNHSLFYDLLKIEKLNDICFYKDIITIINKIQSFFVKYKNNIIFL
jgi:hypothetical protein